jgi:hypothetical protein
MMLPEMLQRHFFKKSFSMVSWRIFRSIRRSAWRSSTAGKEAPRRPILGKAKSPLARHSPRQRSSRLGGSPDSCEQFRPSSLRLRGLARRRFSDHDCKHLGPNPFPHSIQCICSLTRCLSLGVYSKDSQNLSFSRQPQLMRMNLVAY